MPDTVNQMRINILAHNEELFIDDCLESIKKPLENASQQNVIVSVIANGCTDGTYNKAASYCKDLNSWTVYNIELGDKANAWNYAIKLNNGTNPLTIFVDGDCTLSSTALSSLLQTYKNTPEAYIISGIPGTKGNTTKETIKLTLEGNGLSGNFYALTPNFISMIIENNFRLPIGLIGDDSLLAWVSSHDFKLSNGVIPGFLVGSEGAYFYYHRLTPDSLSNIKFYIRRLQKYSLRHLQQSCIREFLNRNDNFEGLPAHISELYKNIKLKHLRLKTVHSAFDILNYLKIKET